MVRPRPGTAPHFIWNWAFMYLAVFLKALMIVYALLSDSITLEPHLSGHLRSQTDSPDNWVTFCWGVGSFTDE